MNIVVGDTFKTKMSEAEYVVERLAGDEITLRHIGNKDVVIDIYLEDVPVIFEV